MRNFYILPKVLYVEVFLLNPSRVFVAVIRKAFAYAQQTSRLQVHKTTSGCRIILTSC